MQPMVVKIHITNGRTILINIFIIYFINRRIKKMNTLGKKIYSLRKEKGLSQEELANHLSVSRQSVQKWETGKSNPEIEKLKKISIFFSISLDELCNNKNSELYSKQIKKNFKYEYKSQIKINNIPLIHINISSSFKTKAKGIIAIGNIAIGIISIGFINLGILTFGLFSLGLISISLIAVGLLAIGCFSLGVIAIGSICAGYLVIGAVAFGKYGLGAYFSGHIGIADTANANLFFDIHNLPSKNEILNQISIQYPKTPNWIKHFFSNYPKY